MSVDSRIKKKTAIFGNWIVDGDAIGDGSGRKNFVYKLKRGHGRWQEYCALKVIPVIEEYGSLDLLSPDEQNSYGERLFQKTQKAKEEIINMEKLRGNTHIVDYLDFDFVDWSEDDCFGRDMYIRMELLHDLRSELKHNRIFSEAEIIKIGCDICDALILCHSNGILHRDIKPDNIFVNKNGNYKLGDFGISKSMPDVVHGYAGTGIGAFAYMPAEQLKGKSNNRVDIYSLGLVLYELCNGNKLPFAQEQFVTDQEVIQRLSGKKFPKPSNASSKLAEVILNACAFNPKDRYATAEDFRFALENVLMDGPVGPSDKLKKIIAAVCIAVICLFLPRIVGVFRERFQIVTPATSIPVTETDYIVPEQKIEDTIPQEVVFENLEPGTIIELGEYEQDGNVANGPESIEWLVLTTEGNEALVISTLGLDSLPYENTKETTDWEGCSARKWLEDTFYKNAFSNYEKSIIVPKMIIQHKNEGYPYCEQGNDTIDHVFLLSTDEYIEYLYNNQTIDSVNRQGIPSVYAQKKNIDIYDYHEGARSWWWLRTSSSYNDKACFVAAMGPSEVYVGYSVNTTGGLIRPAMWVTFTVNDSQDVTKTQTDTVIGEDAGIDLPDIECEHYYEQIIQANGTPAYECKHCHNILLFSNPSLTDLKLLADTNANGKTDDVKYGTFYHNGRKWESAVRFWVANKSGYTSSESIEVYLANAYSELHIVTFAAKESDDKTNMTLRFYGDGQLLYEMTDITKNSEEKYTKIDVTDIEVLKVECSTEKDAFGYCVLHGTVW